jgi:predicted negative regulator of RcsB-dependent stress response
MVILIVTFMLLLLFMICVLAMMFVIYWRIFAQSCIARHTIQSAVWHRIIRQIKHGGLTRLCKCVFGTTAGLEEKT